MCESLLVANFTIDADFGFFIAAGFLRCTRVRGKRQFDVETPMSETNVKKTKRRESYANGM